MVKRMVLSKRQNNILKYLLLLIPFFKPAVVDYVDALHVLDVILGIWKIVSVMFIFFLFLRRRKLDKFVVGVGAFWLCNFLITLFHGGMIYTAGAQFISIVPAIGLLEMSMDEEDTSEGLAALQIILEVLIYSNFISILLFPNGLYTTLIASNSAESQGNLLFGGTYVVNSNWILGIDNGQTMWFVLGIIVSVLQSYSKNQEFRFSFRSFLLFAICVLTPFIREIGTAMIGIALILFGLLTSKLICKHKIACSVFNIGTYVAAIVAFFFGIVIFHQQRIFAFLIEGILHKDITLSKREPIWDMAIQEICMKPIFGWGLQSWEWYFDHIGLNHAHNIILQQLHIGGIIQLIFYLIPHGMCVKKMWQQRYTHMGCFLSIVLFAMLLMNQVETHNSVIYYAALFLIYSVDRIPEKIKKTE